MRRASWTVCIVLVLLLAAPGSLAWSADLHARSVEAHGSSRTTANLQGLFFEQATAGDARGNPQFALEASFLEVTEEYSQFYALDNIVNPLEPEQRSLYTGPGRIKGLQNQDGYALWITDVGLTPARVEVEESRCTRLVPSDHGSERRSYHVATARDDLIVDTSDSLRWQGCSNATVTIQGDLSLTLWYIDAALEGNGRFMRLQSGYDVDTMPDFGDPIGGATNARSAREHFVVAHNATMTIPLEPGTYEAYLRDSSVRGGSLLLVEATGILGDNQVSEGNLELRGDLMASLTSNAETRALDASMNGELDRAEMDGVPLPLASTSIAAPKTSAMLPFLPFLFVPLLGLALAWYVVPHILHVHVRRHHPEARAASLRQRRAQAWSWLSDQADERSHAWTSLLLARFATWSHPNPSYLAQQVRAQCNLGRVEAALRTHARIDRWLQGDDRNRARNAWHAYRLAHRHEHPAGSIWLDRSRRYHPMEFLELSRAWPTAVGRDHAPGMGYA